MPPFRPREDWTVGKALILITCALYIAGLIAFVAYLYVNDVFTH